MLVEREIKKVYVGTNQVRPGKPITTAGIYHNEKLGLISLSSNGTTWMTIADKNLGATSTDVTKESSYGCYYQWGNNYSFPTTGSVTTSGTAVSASSYGPTNYYNSSTFITAQPREGDEREKLYPTTLKSYAEIKSMFISDRTTGIAELNTHPVDYYNKFSSEGKLYNLYGWYYLSDNGQESGLVRDAEYYSPVYNEGVWQAGVM